MHGRQPLRIGTRATKLALIQTQEAVAAIQSQFPDTPLEVREITTSGDEALGQPIGELGASGVFVTELEQALLASEIDIAVHSAKDLPTRLPSGLVIGAALPRADPRDALVTREGLETLAHLPPEATVGTSSARRRALLLEMRPDLQVVSIRGSVESRLAKLDAGEVDAVVLAVAGLKRLGLEGRLTAIFDDEHFVPMAGQGIIALEVRQGELHDICREVSDKTAMAELAAEREFLARCEAGCHAPLGVRAWARERELFVRAVIAHPDGKVVHRGGWTGPRAVGTLNGKLLADKLMAEGGKDYIVAWKKRAATAPAS